MQKTQGKADPELTLTLLKKILGLNEHYNFSIKFKILNEIFSN